MKALDVAKYFLYKANSSGDLISNLKLQKLLYYAQAWYLVNFKKEVLFEDAIEAWDLGPVVPSVYHYFKDFRHTPIDCDVKSSTILGKVRGKDREYLDEFYNKFIRYTATDLVNMSHNEKLWKTAFKNQIKIINIEDMRAYYCELYNKQAKAKN